MAQFALRWILMFDAVTCTIPGAKRPSQAEDNVGAAALPPLSDATMAGGAGRVQPADQAARPSALVGQD